MILKVRRQEKNRHINKEEIASHDNKYLYERSIKEANREKKKEEWSQSIRGLSKELLKYKNSNV